MIDQLIVSLITAAVQSADKYIELRNSLNVRLLIQREIIRISGEQKGLDGDSWFIANQAKFKVISSNFDMLVDAIMSRITSGDTFKTFKGVEVDQMGMMVYWNDHSDSTKMVWLKPEVLSN